MEPAGSVTISSPSTSRIQSEGKDGEQKSGSEVSTPRLGTFMGAIASKEDEVMVFDVGNLLEDPAAPHNDEIGVSYFLDDDLNFPAVDTALLDKSSADLCNVDLLNSAEVERTEPPEWFEYPDLTVDSIPPFDLSDSSQDVHERREKRLKIKVTTSSTSASESDSDHDPNPPPPSAMDHEDSVPSVVSSQASTVSINVLFSPDKFVHHSNGEALEVEKSTGQGSDTTTPLPAVFPPPDKFVHHSNGEPMEVEESSSQGSDTTLHEVLPKPLPLSPSPQNGVTYLRDQFVTECADKAQRFKDLLYCAAEIGI